MADIKMTPLNRRKFIGMSALSVGLLTLSPRLWSASAPRVQAGVQLYTLRDLMAKSVPDTLRLVAEIGYKEVEFAGYFDLKPQALRKILDDLGLSATAAHVPLEALQQEFDATLDAAHKLDHRFLVLPYLNEQQRDTLDKYKKLAAQMNAWGEKCAEAGITLAYHNHDFEFMPLDKQIPYDLLLAETDPKNVVMELDLYWAVKAGRDPQHYFRTHPGRFPLWHLKDMSRDGNFADLGQGVIDFASILAGAEVAGFRHGFVEHDQSAAPVETIRTGFEALKTLGIAGVR